MTIEREREEIPEEKAKEKARALEEQIKKTREKISQKEDDTMGEPQKDELTNFMTESIRRLELFTKDEEVQKKLIEFLDREFDFFEFLSGLEPRYDERSRKIFGIGWKDLLRHLIGKFNDILGKLIKPI